MDRSAERDPDATAAVCGDAELTWAQLADRSARLAGVLRSLGVSRGDRVAIHARKGLVSPVAMHGIMKAGAAYVPLDPFAPTARQQLILEDCGVRHVVADTAAAGQLSELVERGVRLEGIVGSESALPGAEIVRWTEVADAPPGADPGTIELDLAYVLYTSGSTGVPKGVIHTHRSALAFAEVAARTYGFGPADRLTNHAPLHFDLSTMDYFSAAVSGASTVVVPEAYTRFPASLAQLIEKQRPTVLYVVPLVLVQLLVHGALEQRDLSSVRWVLFGGEPFPTTQLREVMRVFPGARFCNVYGPTEVNGITCWMVPELDDDAPIPIGRAYDNVQLRVADDAGRPVEPGEPGELLARTPSMMLGYWGRPDLDARAFHREASAPGIEHVFHRTGDLVRERSDGLLEFLGRKDRQIKTRGHRVELDEVEHALASHGAVAAAASFAVPGSDGSQRIQAAVTLRAAGAVDGVDLSAHVATLLPSYAVPERVSILEEFPRTSSGKIDRLTLRDRAMALDTPDTPAAPADSS
ncbi:MAG: amino acid adenylation domain-containing protein [Gemmatimonadetes bacterium]|nr:amino acid adenylation domain-containing protein [Gemmatimonadota bacterium]